MPARRGRPVGDPIVVVVVDVLVVEVVVVAVVVVGATVDDVVDAVVVAGAVVCDDEQADAAKMNATRPIRLRRIDSS
jgi:hypothetical protein